jgi:hypothetical protein
VGVLGLKEGLEGVQSRHKNNHTTKKYLAAYSNVGLHTCCCGHFKNALRRTCGTFHTKRDLGATLSASLHPNIAFPITETSRIQLVLLAFRIGYWVPKWQLHFGHSFQ